MYNQSKTPVLNHLELFYLRLYTHDLNSNEIADFLESDFATTQKLKNSIVEKYKEKNWEKIVSRAFENKTLKKVDYLDPIVKEEALKNAHVIHENYMIEIINNKTVKDLKHVLMEFYYNCELKLSNHYNIKPENEKLNQLEQEFMKRKWTKFSDKIIVDRINIKQNKEKQLAIKNEIFKKLEVNNWFNAYKKASMFNILDIPTDRNTVLDLHLTTCLRKVIRLKQLKRLLPTEKKLSIYNELLYLYTDIEFSKFAL